MSLLTLVNRLRIETGATGEDLSTLTGVSAESRRMRNWIIQADMEIQEKFHNWQFLRDDVSFSTVAGQNNYSLVECGVADLAEWKPNSFRVYLVSAGVGSEMFLGESAYTNFRDYYLFNARRNTTSRPIQIAIGPDKSLWLGPKPDDIYTVVAEYFKVPTPMSADASETLIPSRFQMAIVYKAMMSYDAFESAPEVLAFGDRKYSEVFSSLLVNQLEAPTLCGPLA